MRIFKVPHKIELPKAIALWRIGPDNAGEGYNKELIFIWEIVAAINWQASHAVGISVNSKISPF